jgi:DNA-directed RNA polymerase specialized sigma24 family protein
VSVTGRDDGYSEFFTREFPAVTRVCFAIVGNRGRAEEITQEVFFAAFRHWRKVSQYERPGAWARKVAVRRAIRSRRSERPEVAVVEPRSAGPDGLGLDLRAAIARLPPKQRGAVALHYLEDRPVAEVAEILGCSESTARVHLHRARAALAGFLVSSED